MTKPASARLRGRRHPSSGLSEEATEGNIHRQLELFGLDSLRAQAGHNKRMVTRLEAASRALSEDFRTSGSRAWTHSAFCYVGLPHRRPASDAEPWHRQNGRCHLLVEPGRIIEHGVPRLVGVPYGALARLILVYIQTHVGDDGVVWLGRSLSAWLKGLRLAVTGGERGTITAVREQMLRLARARISLHWTNDEGTSTAISDQALADGMMLWTDCDPHLRNWTGALRLTPAFLAAIRERPVPLADHALSHLRGSALGLDLYTWLAHRLPREKRHGGTLLKWQQLGEQFGAGFRRADQLGRRICEMLPEVLAVYPGARVDTTPQGLVIYWAPPPVPRETGRRSKRIHAESVTATSFAHAESMTKEADIHAESVTPPLLGHPHNVTGGEQNQRTMAQVHAESVTPDFAPIDSPLAFNSYTKRASCGHPETELGRLP